MPHFSVSSHAQDYDTSFFSLLVQHHDTNSVSSPTPNHDTEPTGARQTPKIPTMAHNPRGRTSSRPQRAYSITSDSPFTLHATPPPTARRSGAGTRGVRANTVDSEVLPEPPVQATRIPAHYSLPPTVPSPFVGDLETSLDAILDWGITQAGAQCIVDALLQPVDARTNWPLLLRTVYIHNSAQNSSREQLESFLFHLTRTLLPEQIAGNRTLMARLYGKKKQLAIRLVLRYDMLRDWKMDHTWHPMAVASVGPSGAVAPLPIVPTKEGRKGLMPNVISTLIAAPEGGWTTHAVRERMKHHITALDAYLLLTDEKVASWSDETVLSMASQMALQWQWLRQNNEILQEMEVNGYEDLEGKADENEWIADDLKRPDWGKAGGGKRGVAAVVDSGE